MTEYTDLSSAIDKAFSESLDDEEASYLSQPAPNIVEWVTGVEYWNVPSTYDHWRQYQLLRDFLNLRCPLCNSMKPEHIDCWGKSRLYLESETLLTWSNEHFDFVCPKCRLTQHELLYDGMFKPYEESIIIVGMRAGKSFWGAHVGGYIEHMLDTFGMTGRGTLQRLLGQEKSEWFEVTFSAATATQAQETIYAKYREMRNNSPWMNRYTVWVKGQEKKQVGEGRDRWEYKLRRDAILDGWNKVRYNRVASDSRGIAGKTRIFASIDEWARLVDTEGSRSAQELYRVLNQSLKTVRSAKSLKGLPEFLGLMINVTSPISLDDPAMDLYEKSKDGALPKIFYWKGATWDFNPFQPREEFDSEFDKDPVGAERDYGANPPNAATPFIQDPKRFWKSIKKDLSPIAKFSYTYTSDVTGKDYIGAKLDFCELDHIFPHYIFVDAGLNWDAFAIVCAHPEWIPEEYVSEGGSGRIERDPQEGYVDAVESGNYVNVSDSSDYIQTRSVEEQHRAHQYQEFMKLKMLGTSMGAGRGHPYEHMSEVLGTVYDFSFRIVPTHTRDIWFDSLIQIIRELKQRIKIAAVCFDQWNSESSIQQIRSMGIQSYKVSLRPEQFMSYLNLANTGRVKHIPPNPADKVSLSETGVLQIGSPQEDMSGESIALVELLKLSRSENLKRFTNENKGQTRGKDSDDVARCIIGANYLVQNSIVDDTQNTQKRKRMIKKRLMATENGMAGGFYPSGGGGNLG